MPDWNIAVPEEELKYEPKTFVPMPNGFYKGVFMSCEYASGQRKDGSEWEAIDVKCNSFMQGDNDKFVKREVSGRFYGDSHAAIVALARALQLAENVDGAWSPLSADLESFAIDATSMAGTPVKTYVQTLPRRRKNDTTGEWEVQMNENTGQPWRDTRIKSVEVID